MLGTVFLGVVAKEAIERAGGVKNIIENAKELGDHVKGRANEVTTAFNERDVNKGAEVAGEIANDSVTAVTKTAGATAEFAVDMYTTGLAKFISAGNNAAESLEEKVDAAFKKEEQRKAEKSKQKTKAM